MGRVSERPVRGLGLAVAVALAFESALYSTIAPLLPHYRDELGLGDAGAGILTASYTAGMLVASVAGGAMANRIGPRPTVLWGFAVLAAASVVFGLAGDIAVLDAARLVQGAGAGLIWAGMLSWLIIVTPVERRGQALGGAMGAAIFGALFGPVIGTVAGAIGPPVAFAVVAAGAVAMALWVLRTPAPAAAVRGPAEALVGFGAFRDRRLLAAFSLNLLPAFVIGMINALVPLHMDDHGASEVLVGGSFLVAASIAGLLSPLLGRRSDRVGPLSVIVTGLVVAVPTLVALALLDGAWSIAVITVIAIGFGISVLSVPSLALLSVLAGSAGLAPGATAALINISFAGGETVGAAGGAAAADATSYALPFLVVAAVFACVAVALALTRHTRFGLTPIASERTS